MVFALRRGGPDPGLGLPPSIDPTPYLKVPVLNHPLALIGLAISFMVTTPLPIGTALSAAKSYALLQAFSWICCLLRLYTRLVVLHAAGWDDFFLVLAQVRNPKQNGPKSLAELTPPTTALDYQRLRRSMHMFVK